MKSLLLASLFIYATAIDEQIIVEIVTEFEHYFHSSCIYFLYNNGKGFEMQTTVNTVQKLLSLHGISTISTTFELKPICLSRRTMYIVFKKGNETKSNIKKVLSNVGFSKVVWLLFLDKNADLEEFFSDINIPFDCEFLVAQPGSYNVISLTEVYRINPTQALRTYLFGNWTAHRGVIWPKIGFYGRRKNLDGYVIRATYNNRFPIFNLDRREGTVYVQGYFGQIWSTIAEEINVKTEYTESESFGSRDNDGSWNGMMALVSKHEVDIGLGDFTLTAERRAAVDFLEPVHVSSIKVFIQLVDRADLIWHSYLVPFSSGLWAAVVASMLLLSLCLSLAANHADSRGQHNTYENFLYVFGSLCQQGQADIVRSSSGRIVSLTAYVTSLVLFAGYSASLISSVTVQSRVLPFTNLPGMLRDGSYRMGVVVNTSYFDIFSEATRDPERAVYNKLIVPHMKDLPKTTPEGFRRICSERKLAFITSELLGLYLSEHSPCVMTTIPEISYSETLTFIISKRNPFRNLINWNLGRIRETGLQNRIRKRNIPGKSDDGRESTKSVEVTAIAPILVILTAGHIVAFLMLFIERKFHNNRIKKRPRKQARS